MARSNRQLTQFAVDSLKRFINNPVPLYAGDVAGNTEVRQQTLSEGLTEYSVRLFGEEIAAIRLARRFPPAVSLSAGDFYDSKGRPSRTTRERLNGILDFLGDEGILPVGVRVFIGEDGACFVGKGDKAQRFDATNPFVNLEVA